MDRIAGCCGSTANAIRGACDWGRVWGLVQPAFNFTASKFVVIKDWRLGVALRGLQATIALYVLFNILLEASYLETEIPSGVILAHSPVNNRASQYSEHFDAIQSGELPYCDSTDYDFQWSNHTFSNFKCTIADSTTLTKKGEDEFFVTTFFSTERVTYATTNEDGSCLSPGEKEIPEGSKKIFEKGNACIYSEREHFFPVSPEDIMLNIIHGYSTSNEIKKQGSLPMTILRSRNSSLEDLTIESLGKLKMRLSKWLAYANVALDEEITDGQGGEEMQGDQGSVFEGKFPRPRLTGVNLIVTFSYYQRKLAPKPYRRSFGKKANDILCLLDIYPLYRWSLQGSDISFMMRSPKEPFFLQKDGLPSDAPPGEVVSSQMDMQKNGVVFSFRVAGQIGRFSTSALIAALVAGSVMLSAAQILVTFAALYALGLSSQLYREFLRESVDWRKEYARYAAQALVAGFAFMSYDRDHSGKLDRQEIFKVLNTVIGHRLSDEKVAALTDFLMRQGESDQSVGKGRFLGEMTSSTISIEEWIDIFTEEKVNLASLERLIDSEYTDAKDLHNLRKVAMKKTTRDRGLPADLLQSMGIPLLASVTEEDDAPEEEEEEEVDPDYIEYTHNKRRFFCEFFLSNDPKVAEPLPTPSVQPATQDHVDIDFSGLDSLIDNDLPTDDKKPGQ